MSPTRRVLRLQLTLGLVFATVCAVGVGTGAWGSEECPTMAVVGAGEQRAGGSGDAAAPAGGADRWAADYTAQQFAAYSQQLDGHYIGVGLWVVRSPEGEVRVTRTLPGGPAALGGVRAGERLLAVGGTQVTGLPITEVVGLLRGGPAGTVGSPVTLALQGDGGVGGGGGVGGDGAASAAPVQDVTLRRALLDEDDVQIDHPARGVTRITMDAFTLGVSEQVQAAVRQLELHPATQGQGILLDLRGNSGGLVSEAVATASVFLDGGPVARYLPKSGAPPQLLQATPGGDTSTPLVVLVDSGTMSAAELLTGALQDRGRAVLVGRPTFGKGAVQQPQTLSDGVVQERTVGDYLTPSGHSPEGQGIQPDVLVPPSASPQAAENTALTVLTDLSGLDGDQ